MDLIQVMARLRPNENVAPDLSTYAKMIAKWRGTGAPPSLKLCEDTWTQILSEIPIEAKVQEEVVKNGITQERMVEAMWRSIAYKDNTLLDELKQIITDAEVKLGAPVSAQLDTPI